MFSPKDIVFVHKYNYQDGGTPTPKILIILEVTSDALLVLEARVTSKQKPPDNLLHHGCNNTIDRDIHYSFYMFDESRVIGKKNDATDFSFDETTFIFFRNNVNQVATTEYAAYSQAPVLLGQLSNEEFKRIVKCARASKFIKKGLKTTFPTFFAPPVAPITTVVISPKI